MARGVPTTKAALDRFAATSLTLDRLTTSDGAGWRRPRRVRGGDDGSTLTYCEATTTITAESGGTVGTGTVQPKKNDGGTLANDGDPVDVVNLHPLEFASGERGYIDLGKDPPEVVNMTCVPEA